LKKKSRGKGEKESRGIASLHLFNSRYIGVWYDG